VEWIWLITNVQNVTAQAVLYSHESRSIGRVEQGMRLTQNHILFWQSKQPQPAWVVKLLDPDSIRGTYRGKFIHHCINDHDDKYSAHLFAYRQRYSQASNTVNLLKMVRRRGGNLEAHLRMWAGSPNPANPHRNNAKRWLRKLHAAEAKVVLV
jgi:hypothetical protein